MDKSLITSFVFEGEAILRVNEREGALQFVAADACRALGIKNPSDALSALDDDEKDVALIYTSGGNQEMPVVSESGLFTLILRCQDAIKPGTLPHRFRRWVTGEVLPTIRRNGSHEVVPALPQSCMPETVKLRIVALALRVFGARAAAEEWFRLELPVVPAMRLMPHQPDLFTAWNPPVVSTSIASLQA